MLKTLKTHALRTARHAGILSATRESAWRRRRLLILGYHGVSTSDEHLWDGELYMRPETLRARFAALRAGGYEVLGLAEAIRRMNDGTLPPRAVALTFDDGAIDFLTQALPILREFEFPATVYLTTYYCQFRRPVFPTMLRYLLWRGRPQTLEMEGLGVDPGPAVLDTAERRDQTFHRIIDPFQGRPGAGETKDAVLTEVARRLGVDYDGLLRQRVLQIMNPEEVASLPKDLIDVQLHTHRHRVPPDQARFAREILDNRRFISEMTGSQTVSHFCYPSGVTNPIYEPWLAALGVTSATTCFPGLASRASNAFMLPRLIDTSFVSDLEFEGWLTGASAFLPRRRIVAVPTI
jgi:peptidoglycan/xylan/chitin deacetylase (PgdA/CDA1 family)